jgi:hypothetical protein
LSDIQSLLLAKVVVFPGSSSLDADIEIYERIFMRQRFLKPLLFAAICFCIAGSLIATSSPAKIAHATSATANSNCPEGQNLSVLPGQLTLHDGDFLVAFTCTGNRITLDYGNGSLGLFIADGGLRIIWVSGGNGTTPGHVSFQSDGNLVVYDSSDKPVWASNTNNQGATRLDLQDDGNLVIYRNSTALWATDTCCWP